MSVRVAASGSRRLVVVNGDPLFVLSGHGMFGQMPGYVLLVYGLKTGK